MLEAVAYGDGELLEVISSHRTYRLVNNEKRHYVFICSEMCMALRWPYWLTVRETTTKLAESQPTTYSFKLDYYWNFFYIRNSIVKIMWKDLYLLVYATGSRWLEINDGLLESALLAYWLVVTGVFSILALKSGRVFRFAVLSSRWFHADPQMPPCGDILVQYGLTKCVGSVTSTSLPSFFYPSAPYIFHSLLASLLLISAPAHQQDQSTWWYYNLWWV